MKRRRAVRSSASRIGHIVSVPVSFTVQPAGDCEEASVGSFSSEPKVSGVAVGDGSADGSAEADGMSSPAPASAIASGSPASGMLASGMLASGTLASRTLASGMLTTWVYNYVHQSNEPYKINFGISLNADLEPTLIVRHFHPDVT